MSVQELKITKVFNPNAVKSLAELVTELQIEQNQERIRKDGSSEELVKDILCDMIATVIIQGCGLDADAKERLYLKYIKDKDDVSLEEVLSPIELEDNA